MHSASLICTSLHDSQYLALSRHPEALPAIGPWVRLFKQLVFYQSGRETNSSIHNIMTGWWHLSCSGVWTMWPATAIGLSRGNRTFFVVLFTGWTKAWEQIGYHTDAPAHQIQNPSWTKASLRNWTDRSVTEPSVCVYRRNLFTASCSRYLVRVGVI